MSLKLLIYPLAALVLVSAGCASSDTPGYIQGMLGASAVAGDELSWEREPTDLEVGTEMGAAPMVLIAGQKPLVGTKDVNVGFEVGASFAWWLSGIDIHGYSFGGGGAAIAFSVENQFWMAELFVGPYGSVLLFDKVRLYGGVGGLCTIGHLDYETEERLWSGETVRESHSDGDFSVGLYGRAGLEYQFAEDMYVGVAVRYVMTDFKFSGLDAKVDMDIWQALVSFTVGL